MTFIEVAGVGFLNKGAELMLRACVEHFRPYPDTHLVMPSNRGTYQRRAELGLYHRIYLNRFKDRSRFIAYLMPSRLREQLGVCDEREIAATLDASGFSYSDQWGPSYTERSYREFSRWKNKRKIILLPQAFGPFERPEVRSITKKTLELADIIFVRDEVSLKHLQKLSLQSPKIELMPDFSVSLVPAPDLVERQSSAALIVPNMRMVDKGSFASKTEYIQHLLQISDRLKKYFSNVEFLIHEVGDLQLKDALASKCRTFYSDDALVLKAKIAKADLLIGSRFHSLVSSLSQCIPSIGLGWSHKYDELFRYYDCESLILKDALDLEALDQMLSRIKERGDELRTSLSVRAEKHKKEIERMWKIVDECLGVQPQLVKSA